MPLTGSGLISLQDIATEFGGSTPHSLSEYYRQPSGPVPRTETTVPTSGLISMSQFYGTEKVVPGSTNFTTAGGHSFVVPAHNTITIEVLGPGGGGGGSWYDAGFAGGPGGAGGQSSAVIPGFGTMIGDTGGGGSTWLSYGTGSAGGASGGNDANTAGGGSAGGAGGVYGSSFGYPGGAGGYSRSIFTFGVTSGAPGQGTTITITVGAGGAGGAGEVFGQTGTVGRVTITWS